jgi:glycogen phosphorylase
MNHQASTKLSLNNYNRSKIQGFELLEELALNLSWSWHRGVDKIWEQIDSELWDLTHNPWIVLQTVSKEKLEKLLSDPHFCQLTRDLVENNRKEQGSEGWFQKNHPKAPLSCIAYFSMEYMLTEGLPIYSGGLGNVAGDQLKAASDLGVPVIGIGLLYQQGYFRQMIDKDGAQQALYPFNDPGQLPITPLRKSNGEWMRMEVALPGYSIWIRAWQVQVGRVKLYLLDSNDAANYPAYRPITSELYGGDSKIRLKQEIILGIGGWRLLENLGIYPEVCHLNEGHAAFAVLERAYSFMKTSGQSFEIALEATRGGNLFTTHTAVPAGFDRFPPSLIKENLSHYAQNKLGISMSTLLALGRQNPNDDDEYFNMAYLAMRGCGAANGVSRLHGKVSRHIFNSLFPNWPEDEIPIGYVTNGVHMPSWNFEFSNNLWAEFCGKECWLEPTEILQNKIEQIPYEKIWKMRNEGRKSLVEFIRKRFAFQQAVAGCPLEEVEKAKHLFDPNHLILGFARRFATYKRPNILLTNPERLLKILKDSKRPVQLVIAGKAHPEDVPGQNLIKEWNHFIKNTSASSQVVFLSDYDMLLTEQLVKGVDVWINTPRRPWEACGTSGMKVLVNGGLNVSELDGWWAEAYTPEVGWAIGDGREHEVNAPCDSVEAEGLYDLLENHIIPQFYERDTQGIPQTWLERIRKSMAYLTPHYSSNRSVREYTEKYYLAAAENYSLRVADKGSLSSRISQWEQNLKQNWNAIHFGEIKVTTNDDHHRFEVPVNLNDITPKDVKVELFIEGNNGNAFSKYEMNCIQKSDDAKTYLYERVVPSERPSNHYTPRVIPAFQNIAIPLEMNQIHWQH